MFWHIFSNRLKCTLRDKGMIFWTMAFPLILATLFNLAFSKINEFSDSFQSINIAVVNNEQYQKDTYFQDFINNTENGDKKFFNVTLTTEEEAVKLLKDGKVTGYILLDNGINLKVTGSGLNQTIIKTALDDYLQTTSTVTDIITNNPAAMQNGLLEDINKRSEYTKNMPLGKKEKPNETVSYFYSLIAMACFYGAFFGLKEVTDVQANISKRAARVNVAPVHKLKALVAGLCAGYLVLLAEVLILIAYIVFVLGNDFGDQIGYILATAMVGCATGIGFGALVSALVKKYEGVKIAILICFTMTATFLSGMMQQSMKYTVEKNAPVLAYINPLTLITDAFYSLYYFDTHAKYFVNMGLLGVFAVVFCLITYFITRRQKYASI